VNRLLRQHFATGGYFVGRYTGITFFDCPNMALRNVSRRRRWLPLAFALTTLVVAGCGESTSPPTPTSITPDATTVADGTAGTALTVTPTFIVRDQNGDPIAGVPVTITVTGGGGTLTGAPTQTSGGPTSIGQWTLGTVAGVNTVTITVAGLDPVIITINGRPGPPANIAFTVGVGAQGFAGSLVSPNPVAQVRDQFNNGIPGVVVTFTLLEGEGTLNGSTVTTNASGNAIVPQWRLGKSDIPQTLRATAGALSATLSAFITTNYFVDLRFFGPTMPPAAAAAFNAAAARIRGAVTGDLADIPTGGGVDMTECGVPGVTLTGTVDDVVIYATVTPIDGVNGVLASAGPCFIRSIGRQTIVGRMTFDADDIQRLVDQGRLRDVILHEMLHVVGIGTLWGQFSLLQGAGSTNPRFTGPQGVAACIGIGGTTSCAGGIAVHTGDGAGSDDSHWRESAFGNELMTPFVGAFNPLSAMSIQSLADVGYATNTGAADSYTIAASVSANVMSSVFGETQGWEVTQKPKFMITTTGRITRVPAQ
jgi:hypothetical protein